MFSCWCIQSIEPVNVFVLMYSVHGTCKCFRAGNSVNADCIIFHFDNSVNAACVFLRVY